MEAKEKNKIKKKKTGGRQKDVGNHPDKKARTAAHTKSQRKWRAKQDKKAKPPGSNLSHPRGFANQTNKHDCSASNSKTRGGWPNEDLMEEHFPGLDDRLRDLREWLLTRVGHPYNDHEAIHEGIKYGIKKGISKFSGPGTRD